MQEEKRSFLLLPDSFNCITPYDIMSLTDFINSAECVAGAREVYLLEPSEIDYEKARTKLIESIKKINQKYFPEGFFDYITGYDDFSCDMVFYPMVISKGELKNFRRNYSEYHTITTALYGKIDEFGRVDITPVTRKKKVEKHEYISPNVETASIQIHPSKGLEKMFTPERKPLKISDIKDDLGDATFGVATNDNLLKLQNEKLISQIEKDINQLVRRQISPNDGYQDVNWVYDRPIFYLVPIWRISFEYEGRVFTSVFSDDLTKESLFLPFKRDPVVEYAISEKPIKLAKIKQKCTAIASIAYMFLCLLYTVPSLFMLSSGVLEAAPFSLIKTLIVCYATLGATIVATRIMFKFIPLANELSSGLPYINDTVTEVKAKIIGFFVLVDTLVVFSFGSLLYNIILRLSALIMTFTTI